MYSDMILGTGEEICIVCKVKKNIEVMHRECDRFATDQRTMWVCNDCGMYESKNG